MENGTDPVEFTDAQLRAALKDVGLEARRQAFAAGRPVFVVRDGKIVALYPDGTEKPVDRPLSQPNAGSSK